MKMLVYSITLVILFVTNLSTAFKLIPGSSISAVTRFRPATFVVRHASPNFDMFDLMGGALHPLGHLPAASSCTRGILPIDIKETDANYEVMIDIPGVEKNDINISIHDDQLVISAERPGMKEEEKDSYLRSERFSGQMTRSLELPPHIDGENIQAESNNGVLHITIPKVEKKPDTKIVVK